MKYLARKRAAGRRITSTGCQEGGAGGGLRNSLSKVIQFADRPRRQIACFAFIVLSRVEQLGESENGSRFSILSSKPARFLPRHAAPVPVAVAQRQTPLNAYLPI